MKYFDDLYGEVEFHESLTPLLEHPLVRRLHGVSQHGWIDILYPSILCSRYDHSIGAAALVNYCGASLEEQAAALLHDISHTAFSHASDSIPEKLTKNRVVSGDESFHEAQKDLFLKTYASSLKEICYEKGWNLEMLMSSENYQVLEKSRPELCADRLDYTFRDGVIMGFITKKDCQRYIRNIVIHNGSMLCLNKKTALEIGELYLKLDQYLWGNPHFCGINELGTQLVATALNLSIISIEDLWLTDVELIRLIKKHKNKDLVRLLNLILSKPAFIKDMKNWDILIDRKPRYIDPPVLFESSVVFCSELDKEYHAKINVLASQLEEKVPLRIFR